MKPDRYYAQIHLAPLLDVVFVTLFVIVLTVSKTYKDTAQLETATHQQQTAELDEQLQQSRTQLRALRTERGELATALTQRNRAFQAVQAALAEKTTEVDMLQSTLARVKEEGTAAQEDAARTAQGYQQTIQNLQAQLHDVQDERATLEEQVASLAQQKNQLSTHLEQKDEELLTTQETLTQTLAEMGATKANLARVEAELGRTQDGLGEEIRVLQEEIAQYKRSIEVLSASIVQLNTDLDTLRAQKAQLEKNLRTTAETLSGVEQEKAVETQRARDYRQQLARVEETLLSGPEEPALATIKSEFVDKYIDIYTIEILPGGRGISRLRLTNKNHKVAERTISTEEQVVHFLRSELSQFDKNRTLIIFIKAHASLYQHEQWVEHYLQENDFPYGQWRRV